MSDVKDYPFRLGRGDAKQHRRFIGPEGSVTYNKDTKRLHVHDGESKGGLEVVSFPEASENGVPHVRIDGQWKPLDEIEFDGGSIAVNVSEPGKFYFSMDGVSYASALDGPITYTPFGTGIDVVRAVLPNGNLVAVPVTDPTLNLIILDDTGGVVTTVAHNLGYTPSAIEVDADGNIYYGCRDSSGSINEPRLAKITQAGTIQWDITLPRGTSGASYSVRSIAVTRDGYVLASVQDNVNFGMGTSSNKVFKLDPADGSVLHEGQYALTANGYAGYVSVLTTRSGRHYVILDKSQDGELLEVDQDLTELNRVDLGYRNIGVAVTSDDAILITPGSSGGTGGDAIKFDHDLNPIWTYSNPSGIFGFNAVATSDLYAFLAVDWPNQIVKVDLVTGKEVDRLIGDNPDDYVDDYMFTTVGKWQVWS